MAASGLSHLIFMAVIRAPINHYRKKTKLRLRDSENNISEFKGTKLDFKEFNSNLKEIK